MNPCRLLFAMLALLGAGSAAAASYCVSTGAELRSALLAAAASAEADVIRLVGVSLTLPNPVDVEVRGSLEIRGGYSEGCPFIGIGQGTTVAGNGSDMFRLRLRLRDGDLTLARVRFSNHGLVAISDLGYSSPVRTGRILVQRARVFGNLSGLQIASNHHDVRVENSRFESSSNEGGNIANGAGLTIRRFAQDAPPIQILVLNNTLTGNHNGLVVAADGAFSDDTRLYNNISFGNRNRDFLLRRPALVRHNIWPVSLIDFDGALKPGSAGNLAVDPQLSATLRPIEPGSPAINAGDNEVPGGLPPVDYLGDPRLVGSRIDIGAYESGVSDLSLLTVLNTNDSGSGSLRQALLNANALSQPARIEFDIAGACPRVITLQSPLPALTQAATIDGYSQPGSAYNEAVDHFDGTLCVALTPAVDIDTGLHLETSSGQTMRVEGLAFYGFRSEAVLVTGTGSASIAGNAFGTGATGLLAPGFADAAIRVINADGSIIGGEDPASRNVIARAAQVGVRLEGSGSRTVRGNLIGFNPAGTVDFGNGTGVQIDGGFRNLVTRNWIGFSGVRGLLIDDTAEPAQETFITDNRFGVTPTYQAAGNARNAIRIEAGEGHRIEFNQILNSGTDGIAIVTPARRVRLYTNSITASAQQAIDISPDGVNDIDLDVGATGANDGQNFPILVDAIGMNHAGEVSGVLESANGSYLIQFFRNAACDADGFGEAQTWVGQVQVSIGNATANANGSASFRADIAGPGNLFDTFITAIATDEEGNSSEASACIAYEEGPQIFRDDFE